jgi:hypothetical protein
MKNTFLLFLILPALLLNGIAAAGASSLDSATVNESSQFQLMAGNVQRLEHNSSQDVAFREYKNTAIVYRKKNWSLLWDMTYLKEQTGNSSSRITSNYSENLFWARQHFYNFDFENSTASVYAGAGIGFLQEKVDTYLLGATHTDSSESIFVAGLGVGFDVTVYLTRNFGFIGSAEMRTLASKGFEPNPLFDYSVRVGIQYDFD